MQNQLADALRHPIVSRIRIDCPACRRVSFETNAPGLARSHRCECGYTMIRMSDPRTGEAERFRPAAVIVPITREEWETAARETEAQIMAAGKETPGPLATRDDIPLGLICLCVICLFLLAILAGGQD